MKLYLVKTDFALYPAYSTDADYLKKIKSGEVMEVEIKKARNPKFHRKFFALLQIGFEAQRAFDAQEWYREWIIMKAGWFEKCKAPNGEFMYRAKSIAFDKMDDTEFSELFRDVQNAIIREHKLTAEQIEENLELFL